MRLRDHDYRSAGAYFVTVCVHGRERLLGAVAEGEVHGSEAGDIVRAAWEGLPNRWPSVRLDALVIMPDHVHGILWLSTELGGPGVAPSLGEVMRAWKSLSSAEVNRRLGRTGPLWQRSYYEHVVRGGADLERFRAYIASNPGRWDEDRGDGDL